MAAVNIAHQAMATPRTIREPKPIGQPPARYLKHRIRPIESRDAPPHRDLVEVKFSHDLWGGRANRSALHIHHESHHKRQTQDVETNSAGTRPEGGHGVYFSAERGQGRFLRSMIVYLSRKMQQQLSDAAISRRQRSSRSTAPRGARHHRVESSPNLRWMVSGREGHDDRRGPRSDT